MNIAIERDRKLRTRPLNIKLINILVAITIGLFIVFPDVSRMLSFKFSDFPQQFENSERNGPSSNEFDQNKSAFPDQFDQPKMPQNDNFKPGEMPPREWNSSWMYKKLVFDFIFYSWLALALLFFNTRRKFFIFKFIKEKNKQSIFLIVGSIFICLLMSLVYSVAVASWLNLFSHGPHFFNGMTVFKCFFAGIVAILFGFIFRLISLQHDMALENERLISENLQNRVNALTAQMNPHFFFNSLNSLASLIRNRQYKNSLKYINELSDIFRYVLKNKGKELVLLNEELQFLEAYRYMLEIRFENKLYFNIDLEDNIGKYYLPALSLQPIIENVVKHNVISTDQPMTITIHIDENKMLNISNPVQRKLDEKNYSTGIGLDNIKNRYNLILKRNITITEENEIFTVKLPLVH